AITLPAASAQGPGVWFWFCPFVFSSRRRHTRSKRDWSSDVCSSDLASFISYRTSLHVCRTLTAHYCATFPLYRTTITQDRKLSVFAYKFHCTIIDGILHRLRFSPIFWQVFM